MPLSIGLSKECMPLRKYQRGESYTGGTKDLKAEAWKEFYTLSLIMSCEHNLKLLTHVKLLELIKMEKIWYIIMEE